MKTNKKYWNISPVWKCKNTSIYGIWINIPESVLRKILKKYRTEKCLKREELSLSLGFDNSYISKLERGTINITIDKLEKIADFFEVDVSKLLQIN